MSKLIACTSCRRHMRTSEAACPFCGTAAPKTAPVRGRPAGRFGRAALVVATTTGVGAVDLTACGESPPIMADAAYGQAEVGMLDHAYGIAADVVQPDAGDADAADAVDEDDATDLDANDGG